MPSFQIPEKLKPFLKVEYILLAILLLAIAVRFSCLYLNLFHHDEAIHALFSYQLLTTGEYMYDPTYHGPFLYYITSAMFSLFGDSDLVGRILPCVFGCALIPLLTGNTVNGKPVIALVAFNSARDSAAVGAVALALGKIALPAQLLLQFQYSLSGIILFEQSIGGLGRQVGIAALRIGQLFALGQHTQHITAHPAGRVFILHFKPDQLGFLLVRLIFSENDHLAVHIDHL